MTRHRPHRLHRRTRHLLGSLLSVPVAALALAVGAPAAAHAAPAPAVADLTCAISGTAHVTPGISLLPQPHTLTGRVQGGTDVSPLTPCTSLDGVPYQGFTMTLSGTGHMACLTAALQGGLSGTGTVTWDNGDTSSVAWSITTAAMVPVVDVTLTGGALKGARVVVAAGPDSLTGNCATDPVTSLGFGGAAEILRLGGS